MTFYCEVISKLLWAWWKRENCGWRRKAWNNTATRCWTWRTRLDDYRAVYSRNANGDTPLHIAALIGDVNIVTTLLDYGWKTCSARNNNNNQTPLHLAFRSISIEAARLVAEETDSVGFDELNFAISSGSAYQSQVVLGPVSPMSSKKSIDLGSIFRKAASVAAKHAIAAATATYDEDEMFPLKCCLMSISLPWDTIAHDLLFKVTNDFIFNIRVIRYFSWADRFHQ
ncbi:unnamed protein product [Arabis nemorensis]|uniref:Uncharacterized protein n=1 Tax=Arabis nemorensis TaxID=586526 RepID=A0A565B6R4_9BRAS|nr:unnamed protein product [Arabis nemorensis]